VAGDTGRAIGLRALSATVGTLKYRRG